MPFTAIYTETGEQLNFYQHAERISELNATGFVCPFCEKPNYGEARFNDLYLAYRRRAEYKGIVFELTKEDFRALTKSNCYYCGQPPSQIVKAGNGVNGEYLYSGIDRVNNDLGYAISNVRPCCKQCNIAKGILTEAEFYAWIRRVAARLVEVNS